MNQNIHKLYSITWKIENFSLCNRENGEYISSPDFIIEHLSHSKWFIQLYPQGNDDDNSDYLSVFLTRSDTSSSSDGIIIDYKLELLDGNESSLHAIKEKNKKFTEGNYEGSKYAISLDALNSEINNWKENVLTVRCDISSNKYDDCTTFGCNAVTKIGIDRCNFDWNLSLPNSTTWMKKRSFKFLPVPMELTITAPDDFIEIQIQKGIPAVCRPFLCRFAVMDVEGNEVVSKQDNHIFATSQSKGGIWKFPYFITKQQLEDEKNNFLDANKFTLKCEIVMCNEMLISRIENYLFQPTLEETVTPEVNMFKSLREDLRDMFTLKKHCDVKLQTGDSTFPAHKAILSARSLVFSAMFDQDMLENQTGIVKIDDIDASTMHDLLECVYTGSVKELDYDKASKLFVAADKYQILTLKQTCSSFLKSYLSISNVCELLTMAAVMDSSLKASAMNYITKNFSKIMSSQEWPDWVKSNTDLATEVFLQLSKCVKNVIKN